MIPLRDAQRSYVTPWITYCIIAINILVFIYEISLEPFSRNEFITRFGVVPARLGSYDLVTSMFLHGGWLHLIGNMWFLYIFGDNIEDVLGRWKFILFYLVCGVAAALGQVAASPDSRIPMIGASGAVAGVMGAYLLKFPHSRILTLVFIFFFVTSVQIPAFIILLYWFVIQLFAGVGSVAASQTEAGGVAWFAHVGGFVAGVILIKLLPTRERFRHRRDLHW